MIRRLSAGIMVVLAATACATTRFDRLLAEQRWTDAASAFAADTSLLNNEDALYRAGLLFGTPGRQTYDPTRAHDLLTALLTRFPNTSHRSGATERLALIDEVLRARQGTAARQHALEVQIATLTAESRTLAARLDSVATQRDTLRSAVARLEADRKERDDQLRALRLELQRLKEIDLKPRTPSPPSPTKP